jgi:hypothetical protein
MVSRAPVLREVGGLTFSGKLLWLGEAAYVFGHAGLPSRRRVPRSDAVSPSETRLGATPMP